MEAATIPSPARFAQLPAGLLRLRSDEQLVALFRAGSEEAFRTIHDRYRARLLAYARQMLGGAHADAEDVLQDVFVRVYAALRASDRPIMLRAWLYRIAHNRCVDGLRRPVPLPSEIVPGALPALSRGARHDPPLEAQRNEDFRRLVRDLQALPDQQRSALLMRELQGLSYEELACSLGLSVSAVKSLLVRARGGVIGASDARAAPCAEIRVELVETHDRGVRASPRARRHLRECAGCHDYRSQLRGTSRQLAALVPPVGLLGQLGLLGGLGGGGAAGGGIVGGGAGGAALAGATAGKVAALVGAAALVSGAAVALPHAGRVVIDHRPPSARQVAPAAPGGRAPAIVRHPPPGYRVVAPLVAVARTTIPVSCPASQVDHAGVAPAQHATGAAAAAAGPITASPTEGQAPAPPSAAAPPASCVSSAVQPAVQAPAPQSSVVSVSAVSESGAAPTVAAPSGDPASRPTTSSTLDPAASVTDGQPSPSGEQPAVANGQTVATDGQPAAAYGKAVAAGGGQIDPAAQPVVIGRGADAVGPGA